MQEIIAEDKELLVYLNGLGTESFDAFWLTVSEVWVWLPFYFILCYFLFKNYRLNSFLFALVFIALGVAASDQLANVFKYGVERLRPCHDPSISDIIRKVKCGGQFGFYSAHASNTFFIATFLSILFKNKLKPLPYILFFWAVFVSYSRIYLGVHFPLDVLTGAVVGSLIGWFFARLSLFVFAKQERAGSA